MTWTTLGSHSSRSVEFMMLSIARFRTSIPVHTTPSSAPTLSWSHHPSVEGAHMGHGFMRVRMNDAVELMMMQGNNQMSGEQKLNKGGL